MTMRYFIPIILVLSFVLTSCESEEEVIRRFEIEKQQRIELEEKLKAEEAERVVAAEKERIEKEQREEAERIARVARFEKERQEKIIYNKYINNSLSTGSTPYAYCFGRNSSCPDRGCSEIKVRTPSSSDVLVTIKRNDKVVRHAFIKRNSSYTFQMPNGTYQPFFYYGKGWNPEKFMKETDCGTLKGGFIQDELFGKDYPQDLSNNILEYTLILQQNGNFSTKPSNANEAL